MGFSDPLGKIKRCSRGEKNLGTYSDCHRRYCEKESLKVISINLSMV